MRKEIKEMISDWKEIVSDQGIFLGILFILVILAFIILLIPFAPFWIINEWSKDWFKDKNET